ncbi:hypothetical protein HJC23_013787 [Cyclotella cryptica]|uniref:Major facilitator superfamily (MFS) profile domain-containing protein n=1 Tax=Cyclotella cryptica TaxID=29204 RepID=A0ABD3PGQ6_9STRA
MVSTGGDRKPPATHHLAMMCASPSEMQNDPPQSTPTLASLCLITLVLNASYSTIAPILPLECDAHFISERWLAIIFLAYPFGICVASPLVSRWFECVGTIQIMVFGMVMVGLLFFGESFVFDVPSSYGKHVDGSSHDQLFWVFLLAMGQFSLGASMSAITTGYYSLATLLFTDHEVAMSCIESSLGMGYVLGAVLGSILYDEYGYQWAYRGISFVVLAMAFVTWRFLTKYFIFKNCKDRIEMDALPSVEAQEILILSTIEDQQEGSQHDGNYSKPNTIARWRSTKSQDVQDESHIDVLQLEAQEPIVNFLFIEKQQQSLHHVNHLKSNPTTFTLLKHAKITCAALTITWISAAWFFLEPILAKRLTHFDLGKRGIGIMFALSNLVYVPTAFCIQFIPKKIIHKHTMIATSILLTPIGVLLVGSNSFAFITFGIVWLGLFPTPVWIMLLPSMQEDASNLFPNQDKKRCVNDLTAGIYNLFITLGQVVGYIIGPLVNQSYGVVTTTRLVAGFIFLQLIVYCVGVGMCGGRLRWQRKARRKGRYFVRYI